MTYKLATQCYFFVVFLSLLANSAEAVKMPSHPVNILTWWGYIDNHSVEIKRIESLCHAHLSHDDYTANDEFVDRLVQHNSHYDIAIFSDTIFTTVKENVTLYSSELHRLTRHYPKPLQRHYRESHFPPNIAFFTLSMTGFLYNPAMVDINSTDSLKAIFDKATQHLIVILDDLVESYIFLNHIIDNNLFDPGDITKPHYFTWKKLKALFKNKYLFIANRPHQIIKQRDFSWAYLWSGEAIDIINSENPKFKFFVHPTLSYLSADLIAALNQNKTTTCVAKALASQQFLNQLQRSTYYFSPYLPKNTIENPIFQAIYTHYLLNPTHWHWVPTIPAEDYPTIKSHWRYIKFKQAQHNDEIP